jgi:hypothetical protein
MTNDEKLMKQALDALEIAEVDGNCCYEATKLLRTRLAQSEPVADDIASIIACREVLDAQPVPPRTEPEQEPVAYIEHHKGGDNLEWENPGGNYTSLYTAPPQRKPLTDDQIDELSRTMVKGSKSANWLCRAIEAAHGIKE